MPLFELIADLIKSQLTKVTKFIKNPLKALRRKTRPIKTLKRSFIRKKKLGERVKRASRNSSKSNKISKILNKSRLVEQLTETQAEILRGKSSATVDTPEFVKDINKSGDLLKTKSKSELKLIEDSLSDALKDLGITNEVEMAQVEANEGKVFEKAFQQSFDTFMDNGKNAFFAYDPEDLGMSDDERDEVGKEIEETKSYEGFVNTKLDAAYKNDKMFKDSKPQVVKL